MSTIISRTGSGATCSAAAKRVLLLTAMLWLGTGPAASSSAGMPWGPELWSLPSEEAPPAEATGAVAPVDRDTIVRLLGEAEAIYQEGRWSQAMEAFKAVTAFDAGNPFAWLRIGNLHHRRGQLLAAASAYRKAAGAAAASVLAAATTAREAGVAAGPGTSTAFRASRASAETVAAASAEPPETQQARIKALINLASVNTELAEAALEQAHKLGHRQPASMAKQPTADELAARIAAMADRVSAAGADIAEPSALPAGPPALRGDRPAPSPARPARTGRERKAAEASSGRPAVEYLRGAPQP